jgi:hypothetical protein
LIKRALETIVRSDGRIYDAVPLADGAVLAALGEGGAHLYAKGGAHRYTFACSAFNLVISDDGRRAIAVGPERVRRRLWHLDLSDGTTQPWCEADLSVFASSFDGRCWYVARGGAMECPVQLIDVQAAGFEARAQADKDAFWPTAMRRLADSLFVEESYLGSAGYQIYRLPALISVEQGDILSPRLTDAPQMIIGSEIPPVVHEPVFLVWEPQSGHSTLCGAPGTWSHPLDGRGARFTASGSWVAAILRSAELAWVACFRIGEAHPRFQHAFGVVPPVGPGPLVEGGVRIEGNRLAAWDDFGELVVVEMEERQLQMRISL